MPALVLTVLSGAAAYLVRPDPPEPTARDYLRGEVTIGVVAGPAGWATVSPDGDWTGFDIDLGRFLAERYQFTPRYIPLQPPEREAAVRTGRVMLVISSYSITDSRRQAIDFAGPYFVDTQGVAFTGSTVADVSDLAGKRVCAASDSTAQARLITLPVTKPVVRETVQSCVAALRRGEADAVLGSRALLESAVARNPPGLIKVAESIALGNEYYGIGIPDNNPRLCTELTAAVAEYLRTDWDNDVRTNLPGLDLRANKPDPDRMFPCERSSPG